jgi:MoaA/NifB/PqqE/SkfB family radical SAM enzyme
MGSRGISFTGGGEPMLHSDFIEIIEKTKQIGFDIGLMTNGSLMNENKIHNVINELQWIRISMGGGNVDSYRKIQGVNHFEKVMQNIELLSEIKKQENSNLNIGIRTLVSKVNLQSLSNLATRIKDLNINYLQLAPDTFTSDEGHFWFSKETHEVFRNIEQILDENKIMLLTAGYSWYKDKLDFPRTCYAHYFQIAIVAEGHLTYCKNARGSENYYIGNIYENTLEVIWGNDRVKNIESWIRPNNCNLFCRNMGLNTSLEETIYPDINMSPNFVN